MCLLIILLSDENNFYIIGLFSKLTSIGLPLFGLRYDGRIVGTYVHYIGA